MVINVTNNSGIFTVTATVTQEQDGVSQEVSVLSGEGTASDPYTITVENDRATRWIRFKKVDIADTSKPLGGAVFDFNNGTETVSITSYDPETTIESVDVSGLMHNEDGTYTFELPMSETAAYTLTEMAPPAGYNMLTAVVNVLVTETEATAQLGDDQNTIVHSTGTGTEDDPYVLLIKNSTGYKLPSTGGSGTILFTLGGMAFLTLAALMGYCESKRKRQERRGNAS